MPLSLSQTEQHIIDVATEIFLRRGKDGARMQEIADRAGINKALLHYYFRSKERLYQQVFAIQVRSFLEEFLGAISDEGDFHLLINRFVESYLDALSHRPEIIRFILWEISRGGDLFSSVAREVLGEHGHDSLPLLDQVSAAIQSGQIRPADPVQVVISMISLCVYPYIARPIIEKILPGLQIDSDDFLQQRKEEVKTLLRKGLAPE